MVIISVPCFFIDPFLKPCFPIDKKVDDSTIVCSLINLIWIKYLVLISFFKAFYLVTVNALTHRQRSAIKITSDLWILRNIKLRKSFSRGPEHRESNNNSREK